FFLRSPSGKSDVPRIRTTLASERACRRLRSAVNGSSGTRRHTATVLPCSSVPQASLRWIRRRCHGHVEALPRNGRVRNGGVPERDGARCLTPAADLDGSGMPSISHTRGLTLILQPPACVVVDD